MNHIDFTEGPAIMSNNNGYYFVYTSQGKCVAQINRPEGVYGQIKVYVKDEQLSSSNDLPWEAEKTDWCEMEQFTPKSFSGGWRGNIQIELDFPSDMQVLLTSSSKIEKACLHMLEVEDNTSNSTTQDPNTQS